MTVHGDSLKIIGGVKIVILLQYCEVLTFSKFLQRIWSLRPNMQPVPAAESVLRTYRDESDNVFTTLLFYNMRNDHSTSTSSSLPHNRATSHCVHCTFVTRIQFIVSTHFIFLFIKFNDANTFLIHCFTSDSSYNFLYANFTTFSAPASPYECAHAQKNVSANGRERRAWHKLCARANKGEELLLTLDRRLAQLTMFAKLTTG